KDDLPSAEQLLNCSVCHRMVSDPRLLPCSHSVCLRCVDSVRDPTDRRTGSCPVCQAKLELPQNSNQLHRDVMKLRLAESVKASVVSTKPCTHSDCKKMSKSVSALSSRAMCEQHLQAELDRLAAEAASLREPVAAALAPASRLSGICGRAAEKKQSLEATQREVESKFKRLREQLEDAETLALKAVRIDIERSSSCSESAESIRAQLEQFQSMGESWSDLQTAGSQGAVQLVDETKRALRQLEHLDDSFATVSDVVKSTVQASVESLKASNEKLCSELEVLLDRKVSGGSVLSLKDSKPVGFEFAPLFVVCLSGVKLMLDSNLYVCKLNGSLPTGATTLPKSIMFVIFKRSNYFDSKQEFQLFSLPNCIPIFGARFALQFPNSYYSRTETIEAIFGASSGCFVVAIYGKLFTADASGKLIKSVGIEDSKLWHFSPESDQLTVSHSSCGVQYVSVFNINLEKIRTVVISASSISSVFAVGPKFMLVDFGDGKVSRVDVDSRSISELAQLDRLVGRHRRTTAEPGAFALFFGAGNAVFVEGKHAVAVNKSGQVVQALQLKNKVSRTATVVRMANQYYLVMLSASCNSMELVSVDPTCF
ncbi:hypothetical protein BOX15_Mlig027094g2, partial [Macrostomum lignano]